MSAGMGARSFRGRSRAVVGSLVVVNRPSSGRWPGGASCAARFVDRADSRPAAIVVLAAAVVAGDADRLARRVHDDDRVHPIGLAGAAVVLD